MCTWLEKKKKERKENSAWNGVCGKFPECTTSEIKGQTQNLDVHGACLGWHVFLGPNLQPRLECFTSTSIIGDSSPSTALPGEEATTKWMTTERNITETVLTKETTAETAEVQVEATARREQCGCLHHEPPHRWVGEEKPPRVTTTSPQVHRRAGEQQNHMTSSATDAIHLDLFGNRNYRCDSRCELRNVNLVGMSTKSWFLDPL